MSITAAINLNSSGAIVHSTDERISAQKNGVGSYQVNGVLGLAVTGWQTAVYRDVNGQNTVFVKLTENTASNSVTVETFDPIDKATPKEIEQVLTLRFEMADLPSATLK